MLKTAAVLAATTALLLGPAPTAMAGDDDREQIRTGGCSGSADWKLKVKEDDGGLEVEWEVDSNRVGQTWRVRIFDNGDRVVRTRAVTRGPSGSFSVERDIADRAGSDRIFAKARHIATGQVCRAVITF